MKNTFTFIHYSLIFHLILCKLKFCVIFVISRQSLICNHEEEDRDVANQSRARSKRRPGRKCYAVPCHKLVSLKTTNLCKRSARFKVERIYESRASRPQIFHVFLLWRDVCSPRCGRDVRAPRGCAFLLAACGGVPHCFFR